MRRMGVYDQIKTAFQDIIAPELHALRGDIRLVDQKIVGLDRLVAQKIAGLDQKLSGLDQKLDGVDARLSVKIDTVRSEVASLRAELVSEVRRVDARIDGVGREL